MNKATHSGFTLVEAMVVLVILAVLTATIVPQFQAAPAESELSRAEFNLQAMRSQLELYRSQHEGRAPSDLGLLTRKTDRYGNIGAGDAYPFGPYLLEIPHSPLHHNNQVVSGDGSALAGSGQAWQYDPETGGLWINRPEFLTR